MVEIINALFDGDIESASFFDSSMMSWAKIVQYREKASLDR